MLVFIHSKETEAWRLDLSSIIEWVSSVEPLWFLRPIELHGNHGHNYLVLYSLRNKSTLWLIIANFPFRALINDDPVRILKSRPTWKNGLQLVVRLCLAASTKYESVTDDRTHRRTDVLYMHTYDHLCDICEFVFMERFTLCHTQVVENRVTIYATNSYYDHWFSLLVLCL